MHKKEKLLGDILVKKGVITQEQLKAALTAQKMSKEFLGTILIERRLIEEGDLLDALSLQYKISFISLTHRYIDWSFVKKFDASLIFDYKCFPVSKDDGSTTMAITNPLDAWVLKKAEDESRGSQVNFVLVTMKDMDEVIERYREYIKGHL
ncbi:MAG: hypothetical protein ABID09_02600 [Candidatus Omnitrophota bacterium]